MKTPPAPKVNSKLLKVPAQELAIHPYAQRELVPSRFKKLVAELDLDAIGVLHAVNYEIRGKGKKIWVIDGQHRLRAIMEHGFGEWQVEVKIHLDVDSDDRASELFLKLNDRSPVRPYDKFLNELKAKEEEAIGVNDVVVKNGMKISASAIDGNVVGIQALKKTYRLDDGKALDKSLNAITQAWGKRCVDAKIIEGVGLLFHRWDGSIDVPAFVKKLAKYPGSAPGLVGDARGLMSFRKVSLSKCISEVLLETYNSGRRIGRLEA